MSHKNKTMETLQINLTAHSFQDTRTRHLKLFFVSHIWIPFTSSLSSMFSRVRVLVSLVTIVSHCEWNLSFRVLWWPNVQLYLSHMWVAELTSVLDTWYRMGVEFIKSHVAPHYWVTTKSRRMVFQLFWEHYRWSQNDWNVWRARIRGTIVPFKY